MLSRARHALVLLAATLAATLVSSHGAQAASQEPQKLPLTRVVLFSSGVGFFQHTGEVTDNARVEFRFKASDINDLLKSMVVQDLDGGKVSAVSYGTKDPVTKTLKTFAVDLTENPTLADLLNQIRGERVEIEAPKRAAGVIVGVEKRRRELGKDQTIESDVLTLLTDFEGLRSVPLETASRIKLLNPQLDAEFRKALALLATGHDNEKKTVTLEFLGQGKRRVQVAYIAETPVWKTSYRLVLTDDKPPYLQGWAIVENTTDDDWTNVDLALVSGRPISFTMDLYQSLYVPRPEEKLELFSSLRPQVYQQDLGRRFAVAAAAAKPADERAIVAEAAPAAPARAYKRSYGGGGMYIRPDLDIQRGVQAAARGGEVGELFQYQIATPVTLARQQSAMLPIVGESLKAEKVSVYNRQVQEKHPLAGLKLTNSTKLHLMQGPITVFDGNAYAGDAMIRDLAPGAERLISYAIDLETEVAVEAKSRPEQLVSVTLARGTMTVTRKLTRTQEYTVRNAGRRAKQLLVEQPAEADWNLVRPAKPAEKTRDQYRFALEAKPAATTALVVEEERVEHQLTALTNVEDASIQLYLSATTVSPKVKQALTEIVKRKGAIADAERKCAELERQAQEITTEQSRIRQNMERLDRTGDLYQRYVKKFSDQEDQLERLRTEATQARTQLDTLRKSLNEYLLGVDIEK
jgi:prefoldin subunit 5